MSSLILSDDFIFETVEGEGHLVGYPSIFMRLAMCNLTCIGFKSPDSPFGCDSYVSWSKKNKRSFEEIFKILEDNGYVEKLKTNHVFKITGGEPLIQQKSLIDFIKAFEDKYKFFPRIDFETNCTIKPGSFWYENSKTTFTVSPKLTSNGDPVEKRYNPEVIKFHKEKGSFFKFVIAKDFDVTEIYDKYVNEFKINKRSVWLMPCCGSRDEHNAVAPWVAEVCKKEGFNFSPRLQLVLWNKALKV